MIFEGARAEERDRGYALLDELTQFVDQPAPREELVGPRFSLGLACALTLGIVAFSLAMTLWLGWALADELGYFKRHRDGSLEILDSSYSEALCQWTSSEELVKGDVTQCAVWRAQIEKGLANKGDWYTGVQINGPAVEVFPFTVELTGEQKVEGYDPAPLVQMKNGKGCLLRWEQQCIIFGTRIRVE